MGKGGGSGGGGNTAGPEAERLAGVQADISRQLFAESSPVRTGAIDQILAALGGVPGQRDELLDPLQFDPIDPITIEDITANPEFAARKAFTESQFDVARQQAIGESARGGTLQSRLGQLGEARAQDLTGQFGQLASQEAARRASERAGALTVDQINRGAIEADINRIIAGTQLFGAGQTGQAIGANQGALSALVGLGANQAAIAQAQSQQQGAKSQGMGQAIGRIGFGLATGGLGAGVGGGFSTDAAGRILGGI